MRKPLIGIVLLSSLLLGACGDIFSKTDQTEDKQTEPANVDTVKMEPVKRKHPFPSVESMGTGSIEVNTPSGDSTDSVPVLFVEDDVLLEQIDITFENFEGSVETFVYINGVFDSKLHAGERTQTFINLTEDNLKVGKYTVTAIQFIDSDNEEDPFNVAEAKFEIKKAE